MSLRKLTLLLTILTTLGLAGILLLSMTTILRRHFNEQERKDVFQTLKQVENALEARLRALETSARALASRQDLLAFAAGQNPGFVQGQLGPSALRDLGADLVLVADRGGGVLSAVLLDEDGQVANRLPAGLAARLAPGSLLLDPASPVGGLLVVDDRPLFLAASPLTRADGGPGGLLVLGKYLDEQMVSEIGEQLLVSLEIYPIDRIKEAPAFSDALAYTPTGAQPYFVTLDDREAAGYARMADIFFQPALLVRVSQFPSIYTNGLLVNAYLTTSVVLITIMFSAMLFLLTELYVLRPVSRLSGAVQSLGSGRSLHQRLPVKGEDEVNMLAAKINEMLALLEDAQARRLASEARFRTLVESMEDVVFTVERQDRRVRVFDKKAPAGEGVETLRQDLEDQLAARQDLLERVFQGGTVQFEWSSQRPYVATLSPIYDPGAGGDGGKAGQISAVVGVSKDVTGLKKLEQELRSRIDELVALFNISRQFLDGIESPEIYALICRLAVEEVGMDAAWLYTPSANELVLFGAAQYGLEGQPDEVSLLAEEGRLPHPAAQVFKDQEIRLATAPAGEPLPSLAYVPLVLFEETAAVLVCARAQPGALDESRLPLLRAFANLARTAMQNRLLFTQVVTGRERLQAASMRLVDIQEDERRKIALELHDEIGQALTGLRLSLDMAHALPEGELRPQLQGAVETLNELIARLRQMSLDLRPSILDDLGVIPTLLWYFDRYTQQTGVAVKFQHSSLQGQRFSPSVEITVFRVIQEALTNVARHAQVQTVNVRLWRGGEILGLQVEDEGVGFEQEDMSKFYNSKGLMGMRERVGFLRGQMNIITQPGEGTCLTVEIPLSGFPERRKHAR